MSFFNHKMQFQATLILVGILMTSCTGLKQLGEGEKLYTGSDIKIEALGKIPGQSELKKEIEDVIRPEPNSIFLGMRPRVWFYNVAGENPKTGVGKWLRNRVGRPPVLWVDFDGDRASSLIQNRLFNSGYFDAKVYYQPVEKEKTARGVFLVSLRPAYILRNVSYPVSSDSLTSIIDSVSQRSLLKPGEYYHLEKLTAERERISGYLRDQGYYFFNPDYFLFKADTAVGDRKVDILLSFKQGMPEEAFHPITLRQVTIVNNPLANPNEPLLGTDSVQIKPGINLINNFDEFRPATLGRAVFLNPGILYNTRNHDLTINHFIGLGVFKFVNLRFDRVAGQPDQIDLRILVTPQERKSISAELSGVSKSNDFAGPGLNITFTNRNFFGGAERFSINAQGSYEFLMGEGRASSIETNITSKLTIPRFVSPIRLNMISPLFIPKTNISLGFNYINRTDAFGLLSVESDFGYEWNQSRTTRHQLTPLVFNIFTLGKVSPQYRDLFTRQQSLRRDLFEQFLLGSKYSYHYNSLLGKAKANNWYLNFNLDFSGNLLYGFFKAFNIEKNEATDGYAMFGQNFSQYSRADFDIRFYHDFNEDKKLVFRLAAGAGLPYGNSSSMPYIKQFTTGGSNSIRAFHPRSLGPGAYLAPDSFDNTFNIYQSGEMKLEANVEYRFPISGFMKGALFADAGNVWNFEEKEGAPGGKFNTNTFAKQIALGTGIGLRFDFTFFILRFDLAFPLAVPYLDSESYFQQLKFANPSWRGDNIVLNLAIGYPF